MKLLFVPLKKKKIDFDSEEFFVFIIFGHFLFLVAALISYDRLVCEIDYCMC